MWKLYHPKCIEVKAVLVTDSAEYPTVWSKEPQKGNGPHMKIEEIDSKNKEKYPWYCCQLEQFLETYSNVPNKDGFYYKSKAIEAYQVPPEVELEVKTIEKTTETATEGDWVCRNPISKEQWVQSDETFRTKYEVD